LISVNYMQVFAIAGLISLSAFGFFALRLLSSFRTGILAKSWRHISVGAIFLILAQLPLIAASLGSSGEESSLLIITGTLMRFLGVVFLTIGLRSQCKVWWSENKHLDHVAKSSAIIEA
jgi:hypothetical protein